MARIEMKTKNPAKSTDDGRRTSSAAFSTHHHGGFQAAAADVSRWLERTEF